MPCACMCATGSWDKPQMSPPRERKWSQPGNQDRKFSWATQRIHDLTKELEAAQARLKVGSGNALSAGAGPGSTERSGGQSWGQWQ